MKRTWAYLLAFLMAVCSCVNPLMEPDPEIDGSTYPEGAKVTITFNVAGEGITPTKAQALGEDQELTSLHLAVFGSSGYLKEYVEATPLGPTGELYSFTGPKDNPEEPDITEEVPVYAFSATLTLTDSRRIIHFIGNGPETLSFGYADAVLSSLRSSSGECAYWQMMHIDGIHAKQYEGEASYEDDYGNTVEPGDYIDVDGNKITNGQGYVVAPATQAKFTEVPLIRNWAKLVIEADTSIPEGGSLPNDPYFEPISYAIVHVPDRGTIAPHSSATNGFIEDYQKKTYFDIVELGYPANLPPDTNIDETIPDIADFKYWDPEETVHGDPAIDLPDGGCRNGVAPANRVGYTKGAVYLYERPVPTDQLPPTFILIYGKYLPEDHNDPNYGKKCFYKVDLMVDRKYYPIYRNFQYRILIHNILAFGHPTPAAAAAAAGSADVSADINARHLADISDGHRRLAIQNWMAKTFTSAQSNNLELSAYFMSDISTGLPNMNANSVTLELLPMKNGIDPVIESSTLSIDPPAANGWRQIHFSTSGPSDNIRSQTLRVIGSSDGESLYRDIVITIQKIQDMRVSCSDRRISSEKGTPVDVYIDIPDGLAQSMFPLEFLIEPEAMTLSPNNDNLPVEYGESISGSGKTSFRFIKSLDWDEYSSLPLELDSSDKLWRRMTCHFISNRALSSTTIHVQNAVYFNDASTELGNFSDKSFADLRILEPIKRNQSGQQLTVEFTVARGDNNELPEIDVIVDGLIPQSRDGLALPAGFTQVSDVMYRFTPTSSTVQLPVVTSDSDGEVYLRLEAEDYESKSVKTHHFTLFNGVGFFDGHATKILSGGWSNVIYGHVNMDNNKNVLFGYYDDPEALNPTINLRNIQSLSVRGITLPWTPDGPRSTDGAYNYHELEFKTTNNNLSMDAIFTLSAPGYLEVTADATRLRGNIYTVSTSSLNSNTNGMSGNSYIVTMDGNTATYHQATVTFSDDFEVKTNGIWLSAGKTGTISITNTNTTTFKFFYIQFNVGVKSAKRLFPKMDSAVIPDGELFMKYPGSNDQCIWLRPEKTEDAQITITAEDDHDFQITGIVLKTFRKN